MPEPGKVGTVVTFYSWKGGVGRTMALANTAVQLARSGHDVLMIDWDLEAPGLDRYFLRGEELEAKHIEVSPAREAGGLLALLSTARQRSDGRLSAEEWPRVTTKIRLQPDEATSTMPMLRCPAVLI
jgi:Mrp family chromosome partitioning ATPase